MRIQNANQNQNSRYSMNNRNNNNNSQGNGDARNMKGNATPPSKKNKQQKVTGIVQPGVRNNSIAGLLQQYSNASRGSGGGTPKTKPPSGNQQSAPSTPTTVKQTSQPSTPTPVYVSFFDYPATNRSALNVKITGMLKD